MTEKSFLNNVCRLNEGNICELIPVRGRKSFYGKCKAIEKDGYSACLSYSTIVCMKTKSGKFKRLWDGYSATTMRHIDSFCSHVGFPSIGKSVWEKMTVGKPYSREKIRELNCC